MVKYILTLLTTLVVLVGCSSISVTDDYNPNVDFSKYKTFAVYKGTMEGSELEKAPLMKQRVLEAINNDMIKKGLTQTDTTDADLLIYAQA